MLFVTIAGFVVGLGAVTVIDIHGFLGRKSSYWTEATIRTHKVTKPLIWLGTVLVLAGSLLLFKTNTLTNTVFSHILEILGVMILNGLFLSFVVSPFLISREKEGKAKELLPSKLQKQITASFLVSFTSWWGLLIYILYIISK